MDKAKEIIRCLNLLEKAEDGIDRAMISIQVKRLVDSEEIECWKCCGIGSVMVKNPITDGTVDCLCPECLGKRVLTLGALT